MGVSWIRQIHLIFASSENFFYRKADSLAAISITRRLGKASSINLSSVIKRQGGSPLLLAPLVLLNDFR
jgi:hypothetical protein